jgi:hypothetical protein
MWYFAVALIIFFILMTKLQIDFINTVQDRDEKIIRWFMAFTSSIFLAFIWPLSILALLSYYVSKKFKK